MVNRNFFPRDSHVVARRKMAVRLAWLLVTFTDVASLDKGFNVALHVGKEKVSTNGGEHSSDAAVCKQNMIPFDGIADECRRRDDAPLIVGALKADQLGAIVFSVGKMIASQKSHGSWVSLLGLSNVYEIKWEDVNVGGIAQHSFVEAEIEFLIEHDGRFVRTAREHGMTTHEVGFHVERAWFVEHFRFEVFHEHAPTEDALGTKVRVDHILVIGVNTDACAPKHGTEGFKNLKNGEKFFFNSRVPDLSGSQFAAVESQRLTSLLNNSAKLFVGSVGFDVKM